jgi:hypothetical protein
MERINSTGAAGNTATLKVSVSKDNGVTFQPAFNVTSFTNAALWPRWHMEGNNVAITELQATGLVA